MKDSILKEYDESIKGFHNCITPNGNFWKTQRKWVEDVVDRLEEYHAKDCAEHERKINTSWLLALAHIPNEMRISIQMKQMELIEKLK